MSNPALTWARKQRGISSGARHQLLLYADSANSKNETWNGQESLADAQGVSVDTVQRRDAELEAAGLIKRRRRYNRRKGGRLNDVVTLLTEKPENTALLEGVKPHQCGLTGVKPHPCGLTGGVKPQSCGSHIDEPSISILPQLKEKPSASAQAVVTMTETVDNLPAEYDDTRHQLWNEGVAILESLDVKRDTAKQMIGKWLKATSDDCSQVLQAIYYARDQQTLSPIPLITATLKKSPRDGPKKSALQIGLEERFKQKFMH